ncbi:Wadjet anti-phage system protein JetD domain-containing protein [Dactylosporangium cerinum]|uniref:Wadjet anti-phage system protein JetD domain-containing protein n=1 Tax=Dactylosporangium cerinum TaxID=1434730 RepID=A0ABV9VN96_9ACTN
MPGRTPAREPWTTPTDVTDVLRRRWDRGDFLAASAAGADWQPVAVPIRAPTAREIAAAFAAAQAWAERWRAADPRLFRLEHRPVGGRHVGTNTLPCRAWIDTPRQLWQILGVTRQAQCFDELIELTRRRAPALVDYLAAQPMKVLHHEQHWAALLDTVLWIEANTGADVYLRQVDVPGVDTKFIEQHRSILASLLDRQLPEHRIVAEVPASDFAGRYRFRKKPAYARVRRLDPSVNLAGPYSDIAIRVDELTATPLQASTVYVVENEVTYLALPSAPDAVVIFGGGYALSTLEPLHWLTERQLIYWGDIDTHGFAILSRLRQLFPSTRSMLMDRTTLLAHETQWVREPTPVSAHLPALDDHEASLYRDLVEDALGPSVRLEQERIRFSAVRTAMSNALPPTLLSTQG